MGDTSQVRSVNEVFRDVREIADRLKELSRELSQLNFYRDESFALAFAAAIAQTTLPENIFSDQSPTTGTVLASSIAQWEQRNTPPAR